MKFKNLVSAVSALAVAGSVFAGLAVTASADVTVPTIKCTQSAGFTNNGTDFVLNTSEKDTPSPVYFNQISGQYKGVAVLEFELPQLNPDEIKSAELSFSVHNGSSRPGGRTYDVYKADIVINSDTTADTLQPIGLSSSLFTGASLSEDTTRTDTVPSANILTYVREKANANATSKIQFAFSNASQALDIDPATAKLDITCFDAGVRTYPVSIKTTPYAKVTVNEDTYYSDVTGTVTLDEAETGTSYNYKIEKGGYSTVEDSATVEETELTINAPLTKSVPDLYYEDFNTTGTINSPIGNESTGPFNIYVKYGTITFTGNNDKLNIYNGGSGPRSVSYPVNISRSSLEVNVDVTFPKNASSWLIMRDSGNQILAKIHCDNTGKVTLGAEGTGYNTFNANPGAGATELGTISAGESVNVDVKIDVGGGKIIAKVGSFTGTVNNFSKADSRGSYNNFNSILIGSDPRYNTVSIDNLSVKEYTAPQPTTVEAENLGAFNGTDGSVATAFKATMGDVTGTVTAAVTSAGKTNNFGGITLENANVILGIVVKDLDDREATATITVE